MKYNYFNLLTTSSFQKNVSIFLSLLFFISCEKEGQATTIEVKDPQRHYFPIAQGEKLHIVYPIKNSGKNLLEIKEIQTSCGCIIVDDSNIKNIVPQSTGYLHFEYDTNKNTGYVQHQIYVYGNFLPNNKIELNFDTHVVPSSLHSKDYEELYKEIQNSNTDVEKLNYGLERQKNYYVGDKPEE
ncbi:DUF1573 domain-containing protein [Flavobacterium oreochromis]|uniref:DUF1573 domain-containing protein n=2 Tax=Flavobacterium TaxID=237 RepID=A0A246GBX8_9FLAO|nr:DUF1573 domain-containing protein [Flavobacterium oreochromis]OWP76786.1 hypothetical protein BWG23_06885 [Flavobacterium oreochromis]OWP78277.1 hypothetical protein BWK62_05585 [Flavobacterium oreochromis]POR30556.1 hypothetical protein BWK58_01525 [Flavobacterium columnare]QYS86824.1 DUF1573 domain-containing protein [Flavobacterium oreochromis]